MKKLFVALLLLLLALCMTCAIAEGSSTMYTSGDYTYILLDDGTAEITGYTGTATALTIPAQIDGHAVTRIGNDAFLECDSLLDITISHGIASIGNRAFRMCHALNGVSIPDSVTSIGYYAFSQCRSLANITIPNSVTSIGAHAFDRCVALTSITIPDSVVSLGSNPFSSCSQLTSINISPNHPTLELFNGVLFDKIEKRLICYPCSLNASSYKIPNGTQIIDSCAFYHCTSLTSVTIPNSVTTIGNLPFGLCTSLTSINIPSSVTQIGGRDLAIGAAELTVTVERGSYAEEYCKIKGLNHTYSAADEVANWLLNWLKMWFFTWLIA